MYSHSGNLNINPGVYIVEFSPPGGGGGKKSKDFGNGEGNQRGKKKGKKIKDNLTLTLESKDNISLLQPPLLPT